MSEIIDQQEKRVNKSNPMSIILLVLLICNFLATTFFGTIILIRQDQKENSNKTVTEISVEYTDKIINRLVESFNSNEYDDLYNVFGEYAKTKISFDETKKSLTKMSVLGKISNYTYINSKVIGDDSIGTWYEVNYSALYDSGSGNIKLSLIKRNGLVEVCGYNFNVPNLR